MTSLDAAYRERDQLVAALSKIWPSRIGIDENESPDWWYVVYVDSPAGQLSWHIPTHERKEFFGHLSVDLGANWDGHTTEEKYRRLASIGES